MPQTVLQTAQAVARAVGIEAPTSLVANTDDTAQRMLQAVRDAGRHLCRRDWARLTYQHSFTTSAGITQYALPATPRWHHMLPGTAWDRTNTSKMSGPLTSVQWQGELGYGLAGTFWARPWSLRADGNRTRVFALVDDPGGAYTIAYDYVTDEWLWDGVAVYYADINADSYQPVFDELLMEAATKWRLLRALGLDWQSDQAEAAGLEAQLYAQERGRPITLGTDVLTWGYNAPEYGFG
jgi:hypothetical protein